MNWGDKKKWLGSIWQPQFILFTASLLHLSTVPVCRLQFWITPNEQYEHMNSNHFEPFWTILVLCFLFHIEMYPTYPFACGHCGLNFCYLLRSPGSFCGLGLMQPHRRKNHLNCSELRFQFGSWWILVILGEIAWTHYTYDAARCKKGLRDLEGNVNRLLDGQ